MIFESIVVADQVVADCIWRTIKRRWRILLLSLLDGESKNRAAPLSSLRCSDRGLNVRTDVDDEIGRKDVSDLSSSLEATYNGMFAGSVYTVGGKLSLGSHA